MSFKEDFDSVIQIVNRGCSSLTTSTCVDCPISIKNWKENDKACGGFYHQQYGDERHKEKAKDWIKAHYLDIMLMELLEK